MNILDKTPVNIISLIMAAICVYCASGGFEVGGRVSEILMFLVLLTIVLVMMFSFGEADFKLSLSTEVFDFKDIIKSGISVFMAFGGIELVMIARPFIDRKNNIMPEICGTVLAIGVVMSVLLFLGWVRYGTVGMTGRWFPVIDMMNSLDFRFSFAQKQDILIMGFWMACLFSAISFGIFFMGTIIKKYFKVRKIYNITAVVLIFIVSVIPGDIADVFRYYDLYVNISGLVFLIIVPVVFYFISVLGGGNTEK